MSSSKKIDYNGVHYTKYNESGEHKGERSIFFMDIISWLCSFIYSNSNKLLNFIFIVYITFNLKICYKDALLRGIMFNKGTCCDSVYLYY